MSNTGNNNANGFRFLNVPKLEFDGKRLRKAIQRRMIDYTSSVMFMLEHRAWCRKAIEYPAILSHPAYIMNYLPPSMLDNNPVNAVATKHVHTSMNKDRNPINVVRWTPEGRRLITAGHSGELTLWNGISFNFETIQQAHDVAIKSMEWSRNGQFMISGDQSGLIKYFQPNMNNIKEFQAHKEPIRGLSFCPTDTKFASCCDDGTIKIWNFQDSTEERTLSGHGWDVKCIGWHPYKSLLASGSKDNLVKLWDPKSGQTLATLHGHKNTIYDLQWNRNGYWLNTVGRDPVVKSYDIRMMKEIASFKGHRKEINSIRWHPIHENLFATGGSDGVINFWMFSTPGKPIASLEGAHDSNIWTLDWHPVGHVLVSGSNDYSTKFWTRHRPMDSMQDKYILGKSVAQSMGISIHDDDANPESSMSGGGGGYQSAQQVRGSSNNNNSSSSNFVPGMTGADMDQFDSGYWKSNNNNNGGSNNNDSRRRRGGGDSATKSNYHQSSNQPFHPPYNNQSYNNNNNNNQYSRSSRPPPPQQPSSDRPNYQRSNTPNHQPNQQTPPPQHYQQTPSPQSYQQAPPPTHFNNRPPPPIQNYQQAPPPPTHYNNRPQNQSQNQSQNYQQNFQQNQNYHQNYHHQHQQHMYQQVGGANSYNQQNYQQHSNNYQRPPLPPTQPPNIRNNGMIRPPLPYQQQAPLPTNQHQHHPYQYQQQQRPSSAQVPAQAQPAPQGFSNLYNSNNANANSSASNTNSKNVSLNQMYNNRSSSNGKR